MENKKKKKGFTLIEMVVVIAIIAIIAGIAVPQAFKSLSKSKKTADVANAKNIANAITQGIGEGHALAASDVWTVVDPDTLGHSGTGDNIKYYFNNYLNTVPETKYGTGNVFYYKYNKDQDELSIGVGTSDTTVKTLFPTVDPEYK